jgi:hypothetical protein
MATSPNYAWAEPDNSSLVKNGAADIRTLGDAIDTSVWNIGFGQAGKNKVINGDFGIWQRGTSGFGAGGVPNADRFFFYGDGTGVTRAITQQTFTPATAPVAGYESQYFFRYNQSVAGTGGALNRFYTKIEDVRTFATNPVTLSFWAKADAARTVTAAVTQNFGSGGSGSVQTSLTGSASVTTSWTRFTFTGTVPSISGKTVGTSSYLEIDIDFPVNVIETIDIWGVQLEYGLKATPFETATGTIQGELAACQRYYYRSTALTGFQTMGSGHATAATTGIMYSPMPVTMRVLPTSVDFSALRLTDTYAWDSAVTALTINSTFNSNTMGVVNCTVASGATAGKFTSLQSNGSGYLGFSAEL